MRDDIVFVEWDEMLEIHRDQLSLHGGQDGFVDENVVRSAMSRPLFTVRYNEEADLADLAADYMYGICSTQGFVDGNKRTALAVAMYFLRRNGVYAALSPSLMYLVTMAVANGQLDRDELAEILRDCIEELPSP